MTFHAWKHWLRSLPWSLRWFVLLVLFRPVLDVLYFLKDVSPFLSPLYIVGALTPVLILISFLLDAFPPKSESFLDVIFGFWGVLLFAGALMLLLYSPSIETLGNAITHVTPVFIYFFVRHLIRSKRDLKGLLMTFLYGTAVPFGMLLFERLVMPLDQLVHTRGYGRYTGLYADVVSYGIYVIGALLIACYFFLDHENLEPPKKRMWRLVIIGSLSILGLLSMHHTASWGVAAALLVLLTLHAAGSKKFSLVAFVVFIGIAGLLLVGDRIQERVGTAIQSEIAVLEGEKDIRYALHGRMSRWSRYFAEWEDVMLVEELFGANLNFDDNVGGVQAGIHNDYLRMLFSTGIVGLVVYLLFYVLLFVKTLSMSSDEKFLVRGAMAIMLLYSITTVPTLYAPLLYLTLCVFAYGALPPSERRVRVPQMRRPHPDACIDTSRLIPRGGR